MGTPLVTALLVLLLALSAVHASTAAPDPDANITSWPALLRAKCGVVDLPEPGSNSGFMGPLRRANTSRASYGYYRFGNASAGRPHLVLLNGLASTAHDWAPSLLQDLAQRQEVLVFDNIGEGWTQDLDPASELTIFDMAEDALDLLDTLDLQQPNLLGLSMGSMIAAAIAASTGDQIPPRVGRLALVSSSPGSPYSHMNATALYRSFLDGTVTFMSFVRGIFDLDDPQGLEAMCQYGIEKAGGVVDPPNPTAFPRHVAAIADFLEGPGVWDSLATIASPVLLVQGSADPLTPAQDALAMVPRLQLPWLAVYPQARHGVLMSEQSSVLRLLDNFLESA